MVRVSRKSRGLAAVAAAGFLSVAAPAMAQQQADPALVARGEYIAKAADCMPCHTGDKSKPFAGGLALNTPFGAIYSPNITSDRSTGIGLWTYDQFVNAVRNGIRKDGAYLYPAMPFDAYTEISDDDMKALWAYVRSIPPIPNTPPANVWNSPSTSASACWPGASCSSIRAASSPPPARARRGTAAPTSSTRSAIVAIATPRAT